MAGRKKIRRSKGKNRNLYFTLETQDSLIFFQNTECMESQKKVYVEKIQPAFEKLVENLIFVYGFKTAYDSFEDLKTDCVSFLYESIHKWKPERGTKAFSYFNVVAKNWLIIKSRQQNKRMKRHVSVDAPDLMTASQKAAYEAYDVVPAPDEILISADLRNQIQQLLEVIAGIVTSESEKTCISAIQTVFVNIDDLDFLNKRAILIYVREISGLSPKQLSVAMSSIRKHYRKLTGYDNKFNLF